MEQDSNKPNKPSNLKTGLLVGGLALFFFVALFVKRTWFT